MLTYTGFVLVGLVAGVLGGFVGLGGGIVIIPALVYLFGFDQLKAQGTSLAILLPPIGILGFLQYWNNPKVDIDLWAAAAIAAAFLVGGYFGGKWANVIDANVVKVAFSIVLLFSGIQMLVTGLMKLCAR